MIVVWSEHALRSKFVLQEADSGLERDVLMPVLRQPVRPPLGFREVHAANLAEWRPGESSPEFETFMADLGELLATSPPTPAALTPSKEPASAFAALEPGAPPASPEPEPVAPPPSVPAALSSPGLAELPAPPPERVPALASGPPPSKATEPVAVPADAATATAGVTARRADIAPSPEPPASAPAALDIPTAPPQRPDPAPEGPAAPPPRRQPLPDPSDTRAVLSSGRTTSPRRLGVLALLVMGAIGTGIYTFAYRHSEPIPPIAAPEPAPMTPPAAEPAPAPEPAPIPPPAPTPTKPSPADVEAALGLSRGDWQAVQLGLKAQGFDAGAADGAVGPKTRQAVAAWQARVGAEATGFLAAGQLDQIRRASRTAGQVFTDTLKDGSPCPFCPEMVVIPAGTFTMGSPVSEAGRGSDEGPQRKVTFNQPFAVGRYEVTFAQWDACVAAGGCAGPRPDDQGWGRGLRPVINVSLEQCPELREMAERPDGRGLPSADGGGVGVRDPRRYDDTILD